MVGKLIKHDLIDSSRAYLPVFGLILLGTLISISLMIISQDPNSVLSLITSLLSIVLFGLMVAVTVMSIKASIYVLYTSLYKEKAYRLFTLPVKTWQILVSKIITSIIWNVLVSIGVLISMLIIVTSTGFNFFEILAGLGEGLKIFFENVQPGIYISFFFNVILDALMGSMVILFAGSLANSSFIRKNRGIVTFAIVLITMMVIGQLSGIFEANFFSVLSRFSYQGMLDGTTRIHIFDFFWVFMYQILLISAFVFGTLWLWENKLEVTL
ncbi:hypothetical protein ERUR111494_03410 [Erysipelothrix urinaevulpis]|uniref:hypothetical protein n=1 Tax=Erysipelothrix urinaevulpis TaxID=2683717 RepID=UPI00135907BA|nr:hypothetical protein [Erysipelothrix urinaevulpis]